MTLPLSHARRVLQVYRGAYTHEIKRDATLCGMTTGNRDRITKGRRAEIDCPSCLRARSQNDG